jgi:FkbM family methyltransferase
MPQSDLIYDVGLHNGDDTAYYLALGYRVVAIEADPNLAALGKQRFRIPIMHDQLQILNVGVADREGTLPFWVCEGKTEWSSFDQSSASRGGRKCHSVDVRCVPFGDIVREFGVPYYLKIDIETHDRTCLEGLDRNDLPTYISLELSDPSVFAALRELGYSRFKIIIQNNHRAIRARPHGFIRTMLSRIPLYVRSIRNRLKLPVYTRKQLLPPDGESVRRKWKFPYGSSGPFGEFADGEWTTFEQVTALFEDFRKGQTEYGNPGALFWHDVHARLDA